MKTVISLQTFLTADNQFNDDTEHVSAKLGAFLREARLQKGFTQEELAERCETNKAYISKVENELKDLRFSTLKKLVEQGLGGQINVTITL